MSTRSSTLTYNQNGQQIYNHYRHYDGYPEGHGKDLAEILISCRNLKGDAQVHAYLDSMELVGCELENKSIIHGDLEYLYKVTLGSPIKMEIIEIDWNDSWDTILHKEPIFSGKPEDFLKSINSPIPEPTITVACHETKLLLPRDFAERLLTTSESNTTKFTDLIEFDDDFTVDIISHATKDTDMPFEIILKDDSGQTIEARRVHDPFAPHMFDKDDTNHHFFKILVDYQSDAKVSATMKTHENM